MYSLTVEPCVVRRRWWQCPACEARLGELTPRGDTLIIAPYPNRRYVLGGGITAQYPHDPALPASESVNCRCRLRIVLPEEK